MAEVICVMPSDPEFPKLDEFARMLCIATNPDVHWNTRLDPSNEGMDLQAPERRALIRTISSAMNDEMHRISVDPMPLSEFMERMGW